MTPHPPPHGINDVDYEAIEAAVTETVRGRWFLNEFARRNRTSEMRQLLEVMARLEATVVASQSSPTLPAADPSVRLLVQRIKDIAGHLDGLVGDMREAGIDERFCGAADLQARAVAGMMRNTTGGATSAVMAPSKPALVAPMPTKVREAELLPQEPVVPDPVVLDPSIPERMNSEPTARPAANAVAGDPRLAALSGFDDLPFAKKLALFT